MKIRELPLEWTQERGQCKGFKFTLMFAGRRANLYRVDTGHTKYYELAVISLRKARPGRDMDNGYDYVEEYPSINRWGELGWTIMTTKKALLKYIEENKKEKGTWGKQ